MSRPHAPLAVCFVSSLLSGIACSGDDGQAAETDTVSGETDAESTGNTTPTGPGSDPAEGSSGGDDPGSTGAPALPCGDGELDPATEACDDGNDIDLDGCNTDCTITGALLWEQAIVPQMEIDGTVYESFSARVEAVVPTPDGEGVLAVGTATFELTSTDWVGSLFIMRLSADGELEWEHHEEDVVGVTLDPWTLRATQLDAGLLLQWSGSDTRTRALFDPGDGSAPASNLWLIEDASPRGISSVIQTAEGVVLSGNHTDGDEPVAFLAPLQADGEVGPDLFTGAAETFFSALAPMADGRFAVVGQTETSLFDNPGHLQLLGDDLAPVWSVDFGSGPAELVAVDDELIVHRSSGTFTLGGGIASYATRTERYAADGTLLWQTSLGLASQLSFAVDAFGSSLAAVEELSDSGSGLDAYALHKHDAQGLTVWEVLGATGEGYEVFTTVDTLTNGAVVLGGFRQNPYDRDAFVRLYAR